MGRHRPGSIDSDGWFDLDQEDGTRKFLNGKRVVSYDPRDNGGRPGVVSTTEDRKAANEASAATGPDSSAPINVDHLADELGAQLQATIQEFWAKAAEAHGFALSAATVAAQAPIDRVVEYATLRLVEALEEG